MRKADGMFGLNWTRFGFNNPAVKFRDLQDGTSMTIAYGETTYDMKDYYWIGSSMPNNVNWARPAGCLATPRFRLGRP